MTSAFAWWASPDTNACASASSGRATAPRSNQASTATVPASSRGGITPTTKKSRGATHIAAPAHTRTKTRSNGVPRWLPTSRLRPATTRMTTTAARTTRGPGWRPSSHTVRGGPPGRPDLLVGLLLGTGSPYDGSAGLLGRHAEPTGQAGAGILDQLLGRRRTRHGVHRARGCEVGAGDLERGQLPGRHQDPRLEGPDGLVVGGDRRPEGPP